MLSANLRSTAYKVARLNAYSGPRWLRVGSGKAALSVFDGVGAARPRPASRLRMLAELRSNDKCVQTH